MTLRDARPAVAAGSIALLILVLYGRTLSYGLAWDDYAALRPRTAAALLAAWTGPWDPGGVWPDFYRPLSVAMYSSLFRVFGHNGTALHAINLAELFLAAWMLRAFVRRETSSPGLGLIAGVLLILNPETPSSLAAWISQQFHLVPLICALSAMLAWQRIRHRRGPIWGWVLAPLALGVLMKEDTLMVLPALLTWQFVRARVIGDVAAPSRAVVGLATLVAVLYGVWRTVALGAIGGYGPPTAWELVLNAVNGPARAFGMLWLMSAHAISLATGAGVAVLIATAWHHRHHARPSVTALALSGLTLGVFANMPLLLISGHTRLHLMILASSLTLTAALGMCADGFAATRRAIPRPAVAGLVAWMIAMAAANWANTNTFAPCGLEAQKRDAEVLTWDLITSADRSEITARLASCGEPGAPE